LIPTSEIALLGCIILNAGKFLDLPKTQSKFGGQIMLTGNQQGDMWLANRNSV
jgi:hypothetical protein